MSNYPGRYSYYWEIFGKDIHTLKGNAVKTKPIPVINDYVEIPKELKEIHKNIELCVDIMYIQGIMFLATISRKIKFITIQSIETGKNLI